MKTLDCDYLFLDIELVIQNRKTFPTQLYKFPILLILFLYPSKFMRNTLRKRLASCSERINVFVKFHSEKQELCYVIIVFVNGCILVRKIGTDKEFIIGN